jgi:hypothetical protein
MSSIRELNCNASEGARVIVVGKDLLLDIARRKEADMARGKVQFLVDAEGRKQSVVLPIKEYEDLLEDLADLAVIAERKNEPAEPLEVVKKRLEEKWQNTGSR